MLKNSDELISDVLEWTPSQRRTGDQLEPIYNSSVRTQDAAWKTCWKRWMRETDGESES